LLIVRLAWTEEFFQPSGADPADSQQQLEGVCSVDACLGQSVQDIGRELLPAFDQAIRDPVCLVEVE
jgi:hypothetical protein